METGCNMQLNRAKQLATIFLNQPVSESELGALVVYHPFLENAFVMDEQGIFNVLEDDERWDAYKKMYHKNVITPCEDIKSILYHVRKSYRLTYLKYLLDEEIVTLRECGNLLAGQWSVIENISYDTNVSKALVLRMIKHADKSCVMDEEEFRVYHSLPNEVNIYRGCKTVKGKEGISWTLDKKTADWFARRWLKDGESGYVWTAKISKDNVVAYINHRGEHEVIVDYRKIYAVEQEEVLK